MRYDTEIKMKVRWNQSVLELLEHEKISEIWAALAGTNQEQPAAEIVTDEMPTGEADSLESLSEALQRGGYEQLVGENKENLTKRIDADQLNAFREKAVAAINSMLVTVDGSKSAPELYESFKGVNLFAKVKGQSNGSYLVWYDVQASGEQLRDARRSATPFRRDHLEKVMFSLIAARGGAEHDSAVDWNDKDLAAKLPEPDRSDLHLGFNLINSNFIYLLLVGVNPGCMQLFVTDIFLNLQVPVLGQWPRCPVARVSQDSQIREPSLQRLDSHLQ